MSYVNAAPLRVVSLNAQTVDETLGVPANVQGYQVVAFILSNTGTTSSGVITLEEADWDEETQTPFSGVWSQIGTVNASAISGQSIVHVSPNCFSWVRARISTVIGGGGTVTVVIRAN